MKKRYFLLVFLLLGIFHSCEKDDVEDYVEPKIAEILSLDILGYDVYTQIDSYDQFVLVEFPVEVTDVNNVVAEFELSEGATATINGVPQVSGETANNFNQCLIYSVESGNGKVTKDWEVYGTNNSYSVLWGLGQFEIGSLSKDRAYSWYIDQGNTGVFSSINCGPTSTTMAAKWSDESFSKTPEDARAAYRSDGGWWYTSDIDSYLTDNSIPHSFIDLSVYENETRQIIKDEIDAGNILILCLDMYYITYESEDEYHVDKFYYTSGTGWGHFIVVKGYKQIDDEFYFEIYDPFSMGDKYSNGVYKGKDRYYRSDDINTATSLWWNHAITVSEKGTKNISKNTGIKDISKIPDMWGR